MPDGTVYFFEDETLTDPTPHGVWLAARRLEEKVGARLLRYIRANGPGQVKIEKATAPMSSTDQPYVSLEVSYK